MVQGFRVLGFWDNTFILFLGPVPQRNHKKFMSIHILGPVPQRSHILGS